MTSLNSKKTPLDFTDAISRLVCMADSSCFRLSVSLIANITTIL